MNAIVIACALFVLAVIAIFKTSKGDGKIKLGFNPVDGEKSNYMDCEAKDPSGTHWKSLNGIWSKVSN